jgi:hypothetical protein
LPIGDCTSFLRGVATILVATPLALLSACDGSGAAEIREGSALSRVNRTESTMRPVPPGDEFVVLRAWVENEATTPVILKRVEVKGLNLDSVVDVVGVMIAPLPEPDASLDFVSGGIYKTYPPVWKFGGRDQCNKQRLVYVNGYTLQPGSFARVLVELRAKSVGDFGVLDHLMIYEQEGTTYSQSVPAQLIGRVTEQVPPLKLERPEKQCIGDGVRVLGRQGSATGIMPTAM